MEYLHKILTNANFPSIYHDTLFFAAILIGIIILRIPISDLLQRIISNKNPITGETNFDPVSPSKTPSKYTLESMSASEVDSAGQEEAEKGATDENYKIGHYYWLGSDLMQAIMSVAYVPNKEQTNYALSQAIRHYRKSGFSDKHLSERLEWVLSLSQNSMDSEWMKDSFRRDLLKELIALRNGLGDYVNAVAGNRFKPFTD